MNLNLAYICSAVVNSIIIIIILYSYPGCCVAKSLPVIAPSRNSDAIASLFISDLHNRMPCVCGHSITFSTKPMIPCASLQSANSTRPHPNIRPVPVKPTLQTLAKVVRPHPQTSHCSEQVVPTLLNTGHKSSENRPSNCASSSTSTSCSASSVQRMQLFHGTKQLPYRLSNEGVQRSATAAETQPGRNVMSLSVSRKRRLPDVRVQMEAPSKHPAAREQFQQAPSHDTCRPVPDNQIVPELVNCV